MRKLKGIISAVMAAVMITSGTGFYGAEMTFGAETENSVVYTDSNAFEFDYGSGTITKYVGSDTDVVIPERIDGIKVEAIESNAFSDRIITSVVIPEGVTSINNAFNSCSLLKSAVIPGSVREWDSAFYNCTELESVEIKEGATSIGSYAFENCYLLKNVTIPESVTSIGNYAFINCYPLTSVTIPEGVTSIGSYAFKSCYSLKSVTIPGSVRDWDDAFNGCTGLESVEIKEGVTSIERNAFLNCAALKSVIIPGSVKSIGNNAFDGCGVLGNLTIPEGVTGIGNYAFRGCSALENITIPNSVTSIGDQAFYNCKGLNSVVIGSGVKTIGTQAFYNCSNLNSVVIGSDNGTIGTSAFAGCIRLNSAEIKEGIRYISGTAFKNCIALSAITLPKGIVSIDASAFDGTNIERVYCYSGGVADNADLYPAGAEIVYLGEDESIEATTESPVELPTVDDVESGGAVEDPTETTSREVVRAEIKSMPEKTQYYATQSFDTTGLSFKVTYTDGSTEIVSDPDKYSLMGFDDDSNQSFYTTGEKTVKANISGVICNIPITVRAIKVVSLNVDYTPIYDTFYVGGKFNFTGLQISAKFEDGSSKVLSFSEYELYMGDTLIDPGVTTITEDMVAPDVAITVMYKADEEGTIDPNNVTGVFNIAIDPGKLVGLEIANYGFKTTYYIGDDFDPSGLTIQGVYQNGDETSYQLISSEFYEVVGFNSEDVNDALELRVQYKDDPSIYTTFTIKVEEAVPVEINILTYPRLTFSVNEAFDAKRLTAGILYTDTRVKNLSDEAIFYKNGTEYYKIYSHDVTDSNGDVLFTSGQRVDITEADLNAADYYVDLSNYDSSAAGTTTVVSICANASYDIPNVDLDVSITESTDHVWKATIFGASSLGVGEQGAGSHITANYKNGESKTTDGTSSGVKAELMENGKLTNIDSIDMVSWDHSGKITNSIDGIAYYYTRVNPDNNFTVSADITVNRYVNDPSTFTDTNLAKYQGYLDQGYSPDVALDMMREGQEAFGIMARDVIPFAGTMINGEYTGDSNCTTLFASQAYKQDYTFTKSDGSTVTYNLPVDTLEAMNEGIKVVDENGEVRELNKTKVAAEISSNMVAAGAATDCSWPKNPSSSTYTKKTLMNRINIMARYNSARLGYYTTTSKLPESGETYNITLSKTNTGFMITTYDYQTGNTATQYMYNDAEEMTNVLTTQDPDNVYVGFYTARWADITVSNIELYETQTTTDPIITGSVDEAVAPQVTISSPYYTNNINYDLIMSSNSSEGMVGGLTSVSLNGKTILSDIILDNKKSSFNVTLKPDCVNNFSVVYYPNTADPNFSSYDPVIIRFTVTHKSENSVNDLKKIYVAPNGSITGDGTRNNPLTLETALDLVDYGGEVVMLDGTYNLTNETIGKVSLDARHSGYQGGNYKALVADEGANPVIDLQKKFGGFEVDADYWYFKGFTVINSKDNSNGFVLGGDHCVVEDCTFVNNGDTGLQISRVNSDDNDIYAWPSYNLIKSCESYNNCDPLGNNADGFAAKINVGYGNVFEDCISHHNADNGWDLCTKLESGAIGPVVLENCITYRNGYKLDEATGADSAYRNTRYIGNGFNMGGGSIYVEHMLKDCISFENKGSGVTSNSNPAIKIRNVVSYCNEYSNFDLYSATTKILSDNEGNISDSAGRNYKFNYDIKGSVSFGSEDSIGSWNVDTTFGNVSSTPIDNESNYLAKSGTVGVNSIGETVDPSTFFVSTDSSTALDSSMRYSRNADGSFNHGDFLARSTPYEHDSADIVTLPDIYGGKGGVGLGETTEEPSETTTSDIDNLFSNSPNKDKKTAESNNGWSIINDNGEFYAKSSNTEDNSSSAISLTIEGPGVLYYEAAVSSEANGDELITICNNSKLPKLSGTNGYSLENPYVNCIVLNEGENVITWEYEKDSSGSAGQDCAWIKNLRVADIGDSNLDGKVDITDAVLGQKYAADSSVISDVLGQKAADHNNDGTVDKTDTAYVLKEIIKSIA